MREACLAGPTLPAKPKYRVSVGPFLSDLDVFPITSTCSWRLRKRPVSWARTSKICAVKVRLTAGTA